MERTLVNEVEVCPVIRCNQCRNVYVKGQHYTAEEVAASAEALGWGFDEPFGALCPEDAKGSKGVDIFRD
jgi:hypothetical protein